jgi:hypothetical protein
LKKINGIIYLLCVFLLAGCDLFKVKPEAVSEEEPETPVARVHEKYLYPKDIADIVPKNATPADSANIMDRFVKNWVKKQLMISEASRRIQFNEPELERKILDYRYALMIYEFEKYYINKELDKKVSEEEVEQYYNKHIDNFLLKQNIIQGQFVKLPKEAPKVDNFREMFRSIDGSQEAELKSYCYRFASNYVLEDSLWLDFDEITLNTPLASLQDKAGFLQENKYAEVEDEHYLYFLKVNEVKTVNEISPLEFVKDQIINIIINKRKVELSNQLEEEIYKRATDNNEFKIYTNS